MTLNEAIKHCEEVIEELEKEAQEWHENQVRKCKLIPFAEMDYTHENECKECASDHKQLAEWLTELKQFKEQEPCEDCVSRQAVTDTVENTIAKYIPILIGRYERIPLELATAIKDLPPATPIQKVGEWIKKNNDYFDWYECSECGYGSDGEMKYNRLCDVRTKFCPDCGSQNLKGE